MKDKLITQVQANMASMLNTAQLEELRRVLTNALHYVEITERKASDTQDAAENGGLLEVFTAAKRIEGCSEKSLKYYDSTIRAMLDSVERPVREISTDDLRGYLATYQRERHSSKVTIDNMRRIFSSFFGWLEDEDYILKSPVRRIHKVKADKPIKETFSDEGLELLRDACDEIRDLAMVDLLASTGMRVGELVNLNREDIDFYERECVVFGKGGSERVVYFDARTKIHLLNYLDSRNDSSPALFVSLTKPHERLLIGGVETRLKEIGGKADMQKVHPHKFRRTMATRAIDKGMPIEQVQRLLGHVKIDTTMHYAMVNQANVKNSHRKYIA
ncbi:MAG: integrase [Proteobacteria bacterium]|nr:integrase [Pseudomonadota bacterium]